MNRKGNGGRKEGKANLLIFHRIMTGLRVVSTRSEMVESIHRISAAVVHADGRLVAWTGNPDLITFWRSAAKPFQALPMLTDGAATHWGLSSEELALACGSHSSEPEHLRVVDGLLAKIGATEHDLACGGHTPLSPAVAADAAKRGITPTSRWSNCSGKHAGMLALARFHGWPTAGYERDGHPVQERLARAIVRWTDHDPSMLHRGVDGCGVVTFSLPLRAMALAYARLGASADPAAAAIRNAMVSHPRLVGGTGRPCTDLMEVADGDAVVKVGADGIYGASLIVDQVGIALKVEDGDMRSAPVALLGLLDQLGAHGGLTAPLARWSRRLPQHARRPIRNTLGAVTGTLEATGMLQFSD